MNFLSRPSGNSVDRWSAQSEARQISFHGQAHEILSPSQTVRVRIREKCPGEATPTPQGFELFRAYLAQCEPGRIDDLEPPCEGLARLLQ